MRHPAEKIQESEAEKAKRRNQMVLDQAKSAGLIGTTKDARLSGRVSANLLAAAKEHTHVASDTELIEALCRNWRSPMISAQNSAGTKVRSPRISISSFDLEEALRRFKPHKNRTLPPRRPDEELQWVADLEMIGAHCLSTPPFTSINSRAEPPKPSTISSKCVVATIPRSALRNSRTFSAASIPLTLKPRARSNKPRSPSTTSRAIASWRRTPMFSAQRSRNSLRTTHAHRSTQRRQTAKALQRRHSLTPRTFPRRRSGHTQSQGFRHPRSNSARNWYYILSAKRLIAFRGAAAKIPIAPGARQFSCEDVRDRA